MEFPLDNLVPLMRGALEAGAVSELRQEGPTYRLFTIGHDGWWYRFASANAGADWVGSVYPGRAEDDGPDLGRQVAMVDLGSSDAQRAGEVFAAELESAAAAIGNRTN